MRSKICIDNKFLGNSSPATPGTTTIEHSDYKSSSQFILGDQRATFTTAPK